jgi:hypothetical protein
MRLVTVFLALIACPALAAETPGSIVGVWTLDLARTMAEHIQAVSREHPELFPQGTLQSRRATVPSEAQQSLLGTLTITDDEMIQANPTSGTTISRYRVIGGNAGSLTLEITGDDGIESVAEVRFVEGGFVIRSPSCVDDPDWCERKARRVAEQGQQAPVAGANSTTRTDSAIVVESESSMDTATAADAGGSTTSSGPAPPTWFYFKRVNR